MRWLGNLPVALFDLGVSSIRLLTSSERVYVGLSGFGIEITATEPLAPQG